MNIYFSSDTHYFHSNIIKYCNRPFLSEQEMNEKMVANWNDIVGDDDIAIHVGDLSAGLRDRKNQLFELIKALKGKKILIRGNHDHLPDQWYIDAGFLKVFDFINCSGLLLTHYPIHLFVQNIDDLSTVGPVEHVIHGHVHKVDVENFENHFNVAVDRNGFKPILIDEIVPQNLLSNAKESIKNLLL